MRLWLVIALMLPLLGSAVPVARSAPAQGAGRHAMVVTEERYATKVGLDVLRAGGNAVDAAVATAYALAVVDPCCGNIGGGGFMLVRTSRGAERFVDFREKAPVRATRDMFLDKRGNAVALRSRKGWLAVAVPGVVLGLETARREFGTLGRAELMAPAIALARDGFVLDAGDTIPFAGATRPGYAGPYTLARQPNVRAIFLPDGGLPRAGQTLKQPELARTLEAIAAGGADTFYRGPIARAIVAASDAGGGILSLADLASYRVEESAPVRCRFRGYDVASAPPPSSGGVTLCEILNVIAPLPFARWGWHDPRSVHYVTEAERRAYADRNAYLGDPDFVSDPVAALLAPAYATELRAQIAPDHATPSTAVRPGLSAVREGDHTTHFSIVDRWGNAVAVTYTLNDWFGADVIAGSTGFLLNDEMDDFTAKPGVANLYGLAQGSRNAVSPGKRPLSSMAPTIVTRNGKLAMVTGSSGGSKIVTTVLETILNVLVYRAGVRQAVDAPRTHMQWLPDLLEYEDGALSASSLVALRSMGYRPQKAPVWGSAQAIVADPATGTLYGGSDRRRPSGAALGY
ncbi:MAG TPA: gamma-glutamyltransferase [Candidatus Tumulicola sp.]|jgi:gamma-glutamyltranspeptidase/glutathione hydrolase